MVLVLFQIFCLGVVEVVHDRFDIHKYNKNTIHDFVVLHVWYCSSQLYTDQASCLSSMHELLLLLQQTLVVDDPLMLSSM